MKQSTNKQNRQAQWRERLGRQAQSCQSVKAFCQSEGVAVPTFYWWRARLAKDDGASLASRPCDAAPFIDLGALGGESPAAGFDIRLALPGGIVLTIATH